MAFYSGLLGGSVGNNFNMKVARNLINPPKNALPQENGMS